MIHTRVRRVRKAKGIMPSFMAGQLGLTRQQYNNIERGINGIDVERLAKIAGLLHEDPGIFFEDSLTDAVIIKVKRGGDSANSHREILSTAEQPGGHEETSASDSENRDSNFDG